MLNSSHSLSAQAPIWLDWVFSNTQTGLMLLDRNCQVVLVNKWLLLRSGLAKEQINGKPLLTVFPSLKGTHFERVLLQAMRSGFPAILSQTLHPAPLPLYTNVSLDGSGNPLRQSIQIVPMGPADAKIAGERYTLVQIADVTSTVLRENLLRAQAEKMSLMAMYDTLTGLGNRRSFDDWLAAEMRAAERARSPMGLMFIDIDHFKLFNDKYGHPEGDICLRKVSEAVRGVCLRPRDRVARFGGEELVVILPDTDKKGALRVAELLLHAVRTLAIPHAASPVHPNVSISIGVSVLDPDSLIESKVLLTQADQAMYSAKAAGRNQMSLYDQLS